MSDFNKQMMEAVTEACRLPQGEIRDNLLSALTSYIQAMAGPRLAVIPDDAISLERPGTIRWMEPR